MILRDFAEQQGDRYRGIRPIGAVHKNLPSQPSGEGVEDGGIPDLISF
jgi:hypothetical protein